MKHCKKRKDFDIGSIGLCHFYTVFKHSRPMRNAVVAVNWQGIFFKDGLKNQL